jgi:hypothetical protein
LEENIILPSPPREYLIPSNLRLRSQEIESQINEEVSRLKFGGSDDSPARDCFIVDFSSSFLPLGLFDRLGVNDFRIDEDFVRSRIIVTMAEDSDKILVLENVKSMVEKLKDEVIGAKLEYKVTAVIWREGERKNIEIDIEEARDAARKKETIRGSDSKRVKLDEYSSWISSSAGEIPPISQKMSPGKTNHVFLVSSSPSTITLLQEDLGRCDVKIAATKPMEKGIDSAMCVVLVLVEKVFDDPNVLAALRYVRENVNGRIRTAEGYLVFLSHYSKEAAPVARSVQRDLERRLVARQEENPILKGARIFLDCDYLVDLRRLEGEVRKSKVLFAFLTKGYFTRAWCLAELIMTSKQVFQ